MRIRPFVLLAAVTATALCQTTTQAPSAPAPLPPDKLSRDLLEKSLQDKNPDTRKNAVIALSLTGPVDPFPAELQAMLDDKDVEVRLATIASLVDLKNDRTVPALKKALADPVPEVSFAAARALYNLGEPDGKGALLSVVEGETKTSSGLFKKETRDAMRMMHTPKTMFMFAIRQGAGLAPVPGLGAGVSSMQALLSDPSVSGRAAATLLVGKERDKQTLDALLDAIDDKDWSVRAAVVHSLALRDDPAVEPKIEPLLTDKSDAVRLRAAAGYLRLEAIKNHPKPKTAPKKTLPKKSAAAPGKA